MRRNQIKDCMRIRIKAAQDVVDTNNKENERGHGSVLLTELNLCFLIKISACLYSHFRRDFKTCASDSISWQS
ncbi:hypothetical protein P8452_70542 [Trifolium repens]|nr:hypothetical protein P8452_70542 [Trifolium repens]